MNTTKTISVLVLAATSAWAQTAASKPSAKTATPASKPKATATKPASQMAPVSAAKTAAPKAAVAKSAAPKAAPKATVAPKAATAKATAAPAKAAPKNAAASTKKPVVKAPAKPAAVKTVPAKTAPAKAVAKSMAPERAIGKRDPFVSVIVARSDVAGACTGGKRCLLVDQLALRGIVRTPTKWIALVENPARKTYYLYENDPIYNAIVVRITGDSVIFRESTMDALGHATEREVVKRVNAPAI